MWKLLTAYLIMGIIALSLTVLFLDKIGARFHHEKTDFEIVIEHVHMMLTHKTFRLLIPLLIFSEMQQAFVFSDFNKAYVACTVGVEYIGYCMIVLGLANVVIALFVALCANKIPREVVFGIGGIIHMGPMIGLLIWIPEARLMTLFIMAAALGVCDAIGRRNAIITLLCITCPDDSDKAFTNVRLLQGFGLTIGFLSGTFLSVAFKLYILIVVLVIAIMFYVLAEYNLRQLDMDTTEDQTKVN